MIGLGWSASMVWNLFGGKKKAEAKAKLRAKNAMPPVMAPNETATPPDRLRAAQADQVDALTVMAAIESAKRELAERETTLRRQAHARANAGLADPAEDPAQAAARKKQLIQAAMAVHRLKQSSFDGLDTQSRDRLRKMAESALGVGQGPKKRS